MQRQLSVEDLDLKDKKEHHLIEALKAHKRDPNLSTLSQKIKEASSTEEKLSFLNTHSAVQQAFKKEELLKFVKTLSLEEELILKELIVLGQWENLLGKPPWELSAAQKLLQKLLPVDAFYHELGGLLGYQEKILSFLKKEELSKEALFYHAPSFIDITEETDAVMHSILSGIESLPFLAEMYPLGGAADRLHLIDEMTGKELPAAKLKFNGKTLLEGLISDLQAREYLYYKLYGKEVITPIAIMTSLEKDNHRHVLQILEEHNWFGRPKETFKVFSQPLVPTVDSDGNWCLSGPLQPVLKPGGHGAIWKLARDAGIFSWLKKLKRRKALIRQINNPAAGLDYGLFAFTGVGFEKEMIFGFASCPRLLKAAEGVNVLIEKEGKEIVLSNIEYCDFEKFGIEDLPLEEKGVYSKFSSNTNILFADLEAISSAVEKCPYPGLLINLKKGSFTTALGEKKEVLFARLESTMQNIADVFVEKKKKRLATERTFVTYNHRHKTISTAKKAYLPEGPFQETPENCFYELNQAARELLEKRCAFQLPAKRGLEEVFRQGPEFQFLYHPALGPLYSIIEQKVFQGELTQGSFFELKIAEVEVKELFLDGSLSIRREEPLGFKDPNGVLHYSDQKGRCILKKVSVKNRGVDWKSSKPLWKHEKRFFETLEIVLKGCSEFVAEGVSFKKGMQIIVEDGVRLIAEQRGEEVIFREERLQKALPLWRYQWEKGPRLKSFKE